MNFFDWKDPGVVCRMVAENRHAFAFLNKMPILPGHTLVCPKRPCQFSREIGDDVWRDILELKEAVCGKLRQALGAEGFNFAWNEGAVAGQTVAHFHLHIVPRGKGDRGIAEYEPRVFLYRPGLRADSPADELESLSKLLRDTIVID